MQVGDTSALEDAKAFNKGKGKLLFGMIALAVSALAAFGWYLVSEQPNPYSGLGRQVNGLRGEFFDGFWTCALPGALLSDIKSDADLRAELHQRGTAGTRYGQHLTEDCEPMLRELGVRLRALLPPERAEAHVGALVEGVTKMIQGLQRYADYLGSAEGYDAEAAEPELETLVRGWYEFRKAHVELNQEIKRQLGR